MKRRERINNPLGNRIAASIEAAALDLMSEDEETLATLSGGAGVEVLEDGTLRVGKFYITSVGMYMADDTSETEWELFGHLMKRLRKTMQLVILDHLAQGRRYGDLEVLATRFGYKYETLKDYLWIVSNVELSMRFDNLSLSHYRVMAPYSDYPLFQRKWLKAASVGEGGKAWGYRKLEQMVETYFPNDPPESPQLDTPAPSRRRDPLERFNKTFEPFELKLRKIAHKAGPQSRAEMAQKLEDMARELRGGGGEQGE